MITKFSYFHETTSTIERWCLNNTVLQQLNFIVAKNATGKSRMLRCIDAFLEMICGKASTYYLGNWNAQFIFDGRQFDYEIKSGGGALSETLYVDEVEVMRRDGDAARLFSQTTQSFISIAPPSNKLVINYRRDQKEYPYFEKLYEFADRAHLFKFGHLHASDLTVDGGGKLQAKGVDDVASIVHNDLSSNDMPAIYNDVNSLGYQIEEISAEMEGSIPKLLVKEKGLLYPVEQRRLSQGMFRTIAIVVYLHYLKGKAMPSLVMVDDVGEGLDYERARGLSKFLLDFFTASLIQAVFSSNHNFFLDQVDLKYWVILTKNGTDINAISETTHRELFRKFKMSGLAPFDIFSSSFLSSAEV